MTVRKDVHCSFCDAPINRVAWNYGKNRAITTFFCNNECKGKWQVLQRENLGFTREWLVNEYITNGKSGDQIAKEIGRDPKRVWEWLVNYGIPTRPRGTDYGNCFKKGMVSTFKGKSHTVEAKLKIREARVRDGGVPYLKNGIHWLKHEGAVSPMWKGGITPERQAFYSSEEWSDAVKDVWKRDNAICQRCGKKHNQKTVRGTFHIHHVVSFKVKELRAKVSNLVLLCYECHKFVHSKKNINDEFLGSEE